MWEGDTWLPFRAHWFRYAGLLGLKFTPEPKWNMYIWNITEDGASMVGTLYCSRKYLTPADNLSLEESDKTKNGVLLKLLSPHCPVLTKVKSDYVAMWVMNHFPTDETLLASSYSVGISKAEKETKNPVSRNKQTVKKERIKKLI